MTEYQTILVQRAADNPRVGIITLNRPQALNALNRQLMLEVVDAATTFDSDPGVGCIIITGSDRAFAAGADIRECGRWHIRGSTSVDRWHGRLPRQALGRILPQLDISQSGAEQRGDRYRAIRFRANLEQCPGRSTRSQEVA